MGIRILVIEDDEEIADFVVRGLREEGYTVEHAADGESGWHALRIGSWDLVVLDWWLPGPDGLTLLRRYRQAGNETPVLFLTARDAVSDKVRGLDHGADDYLCKPFDYEEFLARVRALARRQGKSSDSVVSHSDVRVDLATHRAERAGQRLDLKAKEQALLVFFLRHPDEVLSRTRIYEHVWDERYDGLSNTLEYHVMELRRKLEAHGPRLIHTLRGRGYLFGERRRGADRMSLNTRLSLFFLSTVALILVGFSATLYGAASKYLHRQADERLEAVLNTLVAAAEVNEDGVEWEPEGRKLSFGRRTVEAQFLWAVSDEKGRRLDGSTPTDTGPAWPELIATATHPGRPRGVEDRREQPWRVMARRLQARESVPLDAPDHREGSSAKGEAEKHGELILGAAVSLSGVNETLRNLALMLTGLSCGTWTLALLVGGRLCRRALRPVSEMAEAAHAIAGHDFDERLPTPATGDELEELGRAFNGLLERQHESHERQRRFTGDASHQLRTPLTAIQGHVDLALRQDRSVDEYKRVLAVVQGKTRHLRRIVEALLFLARADAESQRPQLEPIELTEWLRDHMRAWSGPRPDDVRLELEKGGVGAPWVRADPTLLGELLDNLLDNACKYSEPGTPITVCAGRIGESAQLAVEDRGIGIDEGEVLHIMDPFYRTIQARSRDTKGLGLGLSVAARIAEEVFGGRLVVESRRGRGSTFSLLLREAVPPDRSAIDRAEAGSIDAGAD